MHELGEASRRVFLAMEFLEGETLCVSEERYRTVSMRVSPGATPQHLSWSGRESWSPAVSLSKHRLIYIRDRAAADLWRRDLRTGDAQMIIGWNYNQGFPQYSPDDRRIAFQSDRSGMPGLWTCEAGGENCQELTSFGGSVGGTPRWSPDGRWLAFDSRHEGASHIYVIGADGGQPRRLTNGDGENLDPSWSRDGRWIYFASNRSGQWCVCGSRRPLGARPYR